MIIECPVCPKPAPRYKIDASLIGAEGREVRCPRCGHEWFVTPEEVAQQSAPSPQRAPLPEPAPHAGRYPNPQQIVGMTFEAAPPYDEPQQSSGMDGGASRPPSPFSPNKAVSAGAALAGAAAGASDGSSESEVSDDPGTPHVPTTAAEIASAFFASSFEDEPDSPSEERPEAPKTSFSLWAALDSVRPPDDDQAPGHARSAHLDIPEPKSPFHANPSPMHETSSFDDPPAFDEAAEFAHLPDSGEEEVSHSRSESYWGRSFHAAPTSDTVESAYGASKSSSPADPLATPASGRDEELKAALASGVGWSADEPQTASSSTQQSSDVPENWSPAAEAKEIARLVEALNGREPAPAPAHGFGESAPEDRRANYWPSEHHGRGDEFGATPGWRPAAVHPGAEHQDLTDFNDDFAEPDEEPAPRSTPSFLHSRQSYPDQNYPDHDYPDQGYPARQERPFEPIPARTALVRSPSSDFHGDDAFPADFDDALAAAEPRKMGGLAVAAAWGVFITIMAGVGGAAIHFRENVTTHLPGTARLYQALNLPVAIHAGKLELTNVRYRWALRDEQPMIALEGDIVSRSNTVERVPALVVAIRDNDRSFPQKRIENLSTEEIEANGTAHFTVDVTHPPKGVNEIAIEFVK